MQKVVVTAVCILMTLLIGCNSNSVKVSTIYLNHFKSESIGFVLQLCIQSRSNNDSNWVLFCDGINGFDYEWGYNYELSIREEKIENPPQDSSSIKYTLIEVIQKVKEPITSTFNISISIGNDEIPVLIKSSETTFRLFGDKELECTSSDCETIDSLVIQDMAILFEVRHKLNPEDPLELIQIKCSASRESFIESCL